MSSSKGSMQATGKETTESTLPSYLQQPFQQLLGNIQSQFGQGTPNAYGPTSLSSQYFNQASQPASQQLGGIANQVLGSGNNFIGNLAQGVAQNAPNNALGNLAQQVQGSGNNILGNAAGTLLGNTQPVQNWTDPGVAQSWMSPYIQTSLQSQFDLANRQYAGQQAARNAQAIGAGAYGGDRQAIADATAQSQYNQQLQNIAAQGLAQAYQTGQQGFQVQQGLGLEQAGLGGNLQAQQNQFNMMQPEVAGYLQNLQNQYGLQAPSTAAQLQQMQNQYGLQNPSIAASILGQQNAYNLQNLGALGTAAGTQQTLNTEQTMLPYQLLNMQTSLLKQQPGATNQTQTQYQRTNPMASIMGMLGNVAGGVLGGLTGGASTALGAAMGAASPQMSMATPYSSSYGGAGALGNALSGWDSYGPGFPTTAGGLDPYGLGVMG